MTNTPETADQRQARIVAWLEDHDPQLADAIEREFTPDAAEPAVDPLMSAYKAFERDYFRTDDSDEADCAALRTHLPDMIRAAPECIPADVKRGIKREGAGELGEFFAWRGWNAVFTAPVAALVICFVWMVYFAAGWALS